MKLFDIIKEIEKILDGIDGVNEEELDNIKEKFLSLEGDLEYKFENLAKAYTENMRRIGPIKEEIKRLNALKKHYESVADKMKYLLDSSMSKLGIKEMKTNLFRFNYRSSSSVEVFDESLVPEEYKITKQEISKYLISEAIKNKIEVPGAGIVEKQNIQIK